jgi:hypothetical protein
VVTSVIAGRFRLSLRRIPPDRLSRWAAEHPDGLVMECARSAAGAASALVARTYGSGMAAIWAADGSADQALENFTRP